MTFSTLQTLTNSESPVDEKFVPQDDISVANHIARQYIEAGIDPASAYDNPDDALGELGIDFNDLR
jgi:hypothetical protein